MDVYGSLVAFGRRALVDMNIAHCSHFRQMKLQAVMTSTVGSYTQTVECLIEFIRKNVVMMERKMHGKGHLRISQGPFPQRGFPKSSKHSRPSNKFTKGFFNRSRGEDSSDGPRSSGSLGESSH